MLSWRQHCPQRKCPDLPLGSGLHSKTSDVILCTVSGLDRKTLPRYSPMLLAATFIRRHDSVGTRGHRIDCAWYAGCRALARFSAGHQLVVVFIGVKIGHSGLGRVRLDFTTNKLLTTKFFTGLVFFLCI